MSGEVEVVFPDRIHVRTEQLEFIASAAKRVDQHVRDLDAD
jgi:CTP-dependent riboflavin kinase